jgi:hypothetical protein
MVRPILLLAASSAVLLAQHACLLAPNQVGAVRMGDRGMTVAQARQALAGSTFKKSEDADHLPILVVMRNGERVMDLYWNVDDPNMERSKVELARVYDSACATADGLHPGMTVPDVEKLYGKMTQNGDKKEFARLPKWIDVQAAKDAKVESLWISHP